MKKVIAVMVCLILVSACFALESGPSNKVGYVKKTCGIGFTAFGLPFTFWNVVSGVPVYGDTTIMPNMIVGAQTNCTALPSTCDNVIKQSNGAIYCRWPSPSCPPKGNLYTDATRGYMSPAQAYNYQNKSGATRYLVLAGEADTTAASVPAIAITGPVAPANASYTPYSWKDPRDVARNKLNLLQDGFLGGNPGAAYSDQVLSQNTGGTFYYNSGSATWGGTAAGIIAGDAYTIISKHRGVNWNYQYRANGLALTMPGGDDSAPTKTISAPDGKNTSSGTQKMVAPPSPTGKTATTKVKK